MKVEWSAPRLPGPNGCDQGRTQLSCQVRAQCKTGITSKNQGRRQLMMEEEMMEMELVNTIEGCRKTKPGMPFTSQKRHEVRLDGFLDQSGPQATGADFNALGRTLHESANRAEVRPKDPFCAIIGVTHIISH